MRAITCWLACRPELHPFSVLRCHRLGSQRCTVKRYAHACCRDSATMAPSSLQTYIHSSSEKGLSSVSTLIVGTKVAALIDPPFLIPDAEDVVKWIKSKTSLPLKAVFVTHHHPDHFFSANPILQAFPGSELFAAPYGECARAAQRCLDGSIKVVGSEI